MVKPKFWTGDTGRALRAGGRHCQLMALYLVTCSSANSIGIYYLPESLIAAEVGLTVEEVASAWAHFEAIDFAYYDRDRWEVWVPGMARHQIGERLTANDKMRKFVAAQLNGAAQSRFVPEFLRLYGEDFCLGVTGSGEAPSKGLQRGLVSPLVSPLPSPSLPIGHRSLVIGHRTGESYDSPSAGDFEVLWQVCQKRVAKAAAARAFESLGKAGKLPPVAELVAKLTALQATDQWSRDDRQFQPHLATWLNREGWNDELPRGGSGRRADPRRAAGGTPESVAAYGQVGGPAVNLEELEG